MGKSKDLAIINSEQEYRSYLIEQERERETHYQAEKAIERPKDDITWEVMEDLAARAKKGYKKYNTTLKENNHQNMLQHAYEEALDLAQ